MTSGILATIAADWKQRKAAIFFRRRPTEPLCRVSYDCGAMMQLALDNGNRDAEGMAVVVIENGRYSEGAALRLANLAARTLRPTAVTVVSEWRSE